MFIVEQLCIDPAIGITIPARDWYESTLDNSFSPKNSVQLLEGCQGPVLQVPSSSSTRICSDNLGSIH